MSAPLHLCIPGSLGETCSPCLHVHTRMLRSLLKMGSPDLIPKTMKEDFQWWGLGFLESVIQQSNGIYLMARLIWKQGYCLEPEQVGTLDSVFHHLVLFFVINKQKITLPGFVSLSCLFYYHLDKPMGPFYYLILT